MSNLKFGSLLFLCAFSTSLAALTGCGKDEPAAEQIKQGLERPEFSDDQGDKLSSSDRDGFIKAVSDRYNLRVVEDDKSYDAEARNNRVLRLIAANRDRIKPELENVIELHIGSSFSRSEVTEGKLRVTIDNRASEEEILLWLSHSYDKYRAGTKFTALASRTGLRGISDLKGLSADEAAGFSDRFAEAVRGFDFSLPYASILAQNVVIDRHYGVGSSYVVVPFDASSESIKSFYADVFALSRHISDDFATLTSELGVSVNYQIDVLMPREIEQGIRNLGAAKSQIRAEGRIKKTIKIGRRTETDSIRAKAADCLLIAFSAGDKEISSAMDLLGTDIDAAFASLQATVVAKYRNSGVSFDISLRDLTSSVSPKETALQKARDLTSTLLSIARPERLAAIRVDQISASSYSNPPTISKQSDGTATLSILTRDLDATALERAIRDYEGSFSVDQRLAIQKRMLEGLRSQYYSSSVSIEYSDSVLDPSSAEKSQQMQRIVAFFAQVASAARLSKIGVNKVTFVRGAPSEAESVVLTGTTLQVDAYLATSAVLEQVLHQRETPAPIPAL